MNDWERFLRGQVDGGAPTASVEGTATVCCFGDLDVEYRALAGGPALVDRSYRSLLEVRGADRASWLHNLTTNQVKPLAPGEGNYAFALSPQGRIQFDLNILVREGSIWIDIDRSFLGVAQAYFSKYAVIEDVSVVDRCRDFVRLAIAGQGAATLLAGLGAAHVQTMPLLGTAQLSWQGIPITFVRHDFCGPFAVELFVPPAHSEGLWQYLVDRSRAVPAVPVGDDAVQVHRIEAGIPWPGREITDEVLPGETGMLERTVSINKGCYIGQEVVERMRSRGVVARNLISVEIAGALTPPPGAEVLDTTGRSIGRLTSVCRSPGRGCVMGLGYVKSAAASAGGQLRVQWGDGECAAVVVGLPSSDDSDR